MPVRWLASRRHCRRNWRRRSATGPCLGSKRDRRRLGPPGLPPYRRHSTEVRLAGLERFAFRPRPHRRPSAGTAARVVRGRVARRRASHPPAQIRQNDSRVIASCAPFECTNSEAKFSPNWDRRKMAGGGRLEHLALFRADVFRFPCGFFEETRPRILVICRRAENVAKRASGGQTERSGTTGGLVPPAR